MISILPRQHRVRTGDGGEEAESDDLQDVGEHEEIPGDILFAADKSCETSAEGGEEEQREHFDAGVDGGEVVFHLEALGEEDDGDHEGKAG